MKSMGKYDTGTFIEIERERRKTQQKDKDKEIRSKRKINHRKGGQMRNQP